jgi:hypothetical protein
VGARVMPPSWAVIEAIEAIVDGWRMGIASDDGDYGRKADDGSE